MHRLREVVNDCGLKPVGFDAGMSSCVDSSRGQETQAARPAGGHGPSRHPSVTEVTEVPRPRIWFLCSGSPFPRPPWPCGQPWAPRAPRSLGRAVPPRPFVSSPTSRVRLGTLPSGTAPSQSAGTVSRPRRVSSPSRPSRGLSHLGSFRCVQSCDLLATRCGFALALVTVRWHRLSQCGPSALPIVSMDAFSFYFANINKM